MLEGLWEAVAEVRDRVRCGSSATSTDTTTPVVLDNDATLVEIHSENEAGAAPN